MAVDSLTVRRERLMTDGNLGERWWGGMMNRIRLGGGLGEEERSRLRSVLPIIKVGVRADSWYENIVSDLSGTVELASNEADKSLLADSLEAVSKEMTMRFDGLRGWGLEKGREAAELAVAGWGKLLICGNDGQKAKALNFFDSKEERLGGLTFLNDGAREAWDYYRMYRIGLGGEEGEMMSEKVRKQMGTEGVEKVILRVLWESSRMLPDKARLLTTGLALAVGVDREIVNDLVNSWMTFNYRDRDILMKSGMSLGGIVSRNLEVIMALRKVDPISIKQMHHDFGITHFGAYPVNLMIEQWQERDNLEAGYGIRIGEYDNYNGSNYSDLENIVGLWKSAKELGLMSRVVEARGKMTAARRIEWLRRTYGGSENRIKFGYIHGHGGEGKVWLGAGEEGVITAGDLKKGSALKLRDAFEEGAPFAFGSCFGAVIAGKYSQFFGGHGVGQSNSGGPQGLKLARDFDGRLIYIEAKYTKNNVWVEPVDYLAGRVWPAAEKEELRQKLLLEEARGIVGVPEKLREAWENPRMEPVLRLMLKELKLRPIVERIKKDFGGMEIAIGVEDCVAGDLEEDKSEGQFCDFVDLRDKFGYEGGVYRTKYGLVDSLDPEFLIGSFIKLARRARQNWVEKGERIYPLISIWEAGGSNQEYGGYVVDVRDVVG